MSENRRILIVEDEPLIAEEMRCYLEEAAYELSGIAHSVGDALNILDKGGTDLVLVDINLGQALNGIDLAKLINERYKIPFIFITSYGDKATIDSSKQTMPAGYILKPFEEMELLANIEIALFKIKNNGRQEKLSISKEPLFVKDRGKLVRIELNDILWAQAYDNYTFLQTAMDKRLVSHPLKWVEDYLSGHNFIRVHRSYLINFDKVDSICENKLIIGKHEIPMGRTYKEDLIKMITSI
ncbi:response regulator receiver [Fulvivirga imtechensis AK7]|uniref:Response regulator receiver n=1 Tax=Fulvivirga imtechensis AK7 TaxID=1237149 RepID=L8JYN0_9BACT|nr:response regulator [Fulvivirga imtechensis]ELR73905.1 response regulator receiver [Fulvivirga imtechensis AK7]